MQASAPLVQVHCGRRQPWGQPALGCPVQRRSAILSPT